MTGTDDLLVVGGGPAGLVTAVCARRAGLSVTVIEPRTAPVDKACGEGLMPPAVATLRRLGVHPAGHPFVGISYLDPDHIATADFRAGPGLGVRRTELHARLHEAAVDAGIEIVVARVDDVRQEERGVVAAGLRARYLVGADGLHSTVRRAAGLHRPVPAQRWGVRAHFACAPWSDRVEVHWSPSSEAYVTPVAPDCVGVAVLGGDQRPFADRLRDFPALVQRLPAAPVDRPRGAGPLRQRAASRVHGRVLLVGDAAGYVDALTGEGLSIAFRCAHALVDRVCGGETERYEHDYRAITRRYQLITVAMLAAARRPALRRMIVPAAARMPAVFAGAVNALAH